MKSPKARYSSLNDTAAAEEKTPFMDTECSAPVHASQPRPRHSLTVIFTLIASLACNVLFLTIAFLSSTSSSTSHSSSSISTKLYSPAQHVLRPTLRKFSSAFHPEGPDAIFQQAPSAAVDAAWRDLYVTTLAIDRSAAALLPNKTIPVSPAPDAPYLTGLSVFHDLHCLDSIRQALWASSENATASSLHEMHDAKHLMHCVNGLRQTIMCHADVAPLSWQWTRQEGDVRVYQDVLHQCSDFESVLNWARDHEFTGSLDTTLYPDRHPPEIGRCGVDDEGCGDDLVA